MQADSLLSLPTAEVIRLGLVSNRGMIVMAAAFGAAWQAFPDRMVADYFERFARQLFGYASHLQYGWITTAAAALALLLLASLLLRLLSVLLALVQYHGFRLSEEQRRLTVERGLLSKLRTSVARRRIQAWTLHEGFLHRLLKRRSLRIDTAVAEQQGKNDQRALKELAPIATPDACDALIQHLLPQAQWPRSEWTVLPAAVWWRIFLPTLIFIVILALVLASYFQNAWGLAPLLWLPWSAFAAIQQARRAGYAVDDRLVAIRGGWWSRYWRFAEIDKLQALRLVRSPMDRRMGTASLWLDTAGASGLAPPLRIRFLPEADARLLYLQLGRALGPTQVAVVNRRRLPDQALNTAIMRSRNLRSFCRKNSLAARPSDSHCSSSRANARSTASVISEEVDKPVVAVAWRPVRATGIRMPRSAVTSSFIGAPSVVRVTAPTLSASIR